MPSNRSTMLWIAMLVVVVAGYVVELAFLLYAARGKISLFLIGVGAWYALPLLLVVAASALCRRNQIAGLLALLNAIAVVALGIGFQFQVLFVGRPDAQSGIALIFIPPYQFRAALPLLLLSCIAAVVGESHTPAAKALPETDD